MTLITLKQAAKEVLHIHYDTFRRRRALGYYKGCFYKAGPKAREQVVKEKLEDELKEKVN